MNGKELSQRYAAMSDEELAIEAKNLSGGAHETLHVLLQELRKRGMNDQVGNIVKSHLRSKQQSKILAIEIKQRYASMSNKELAREAKKYGGGDEKSLLILIDELGKRGMEKEAEDAVDYMDYMIVVPREMNRIRNNSKAKISEYVEEEVQPQNQNEVQKSKRQWFKLNWKIASVILLIILALALIFFLWTSIF